MIREHFQGLTDPRIERAQRHNLLDIVALTICAVICGADHEVEIAEFGQAKADWLRGFLALPNGIPSPDILGRVSAGGIRSSSKPAFWTGCGP